MSLHQLPVLSTLNLKAPGPIGGTTPSTGAFTTLSASGTLTLGQGVGAGIISTPSGNLAISNGWLNINGSHFLSEAANTLAMRNGTFAQTQRWYNTYTDASNYERGALTWSGNAFYVGTEISGTGVARDIHFMRGNTARWSITPHLLAVADNTYDIGASGANRPRTGYFGSGVVWSSTAHQLISDGSGVPIIRAGGAGNRVRISGNGGAGDDQLIFGSIAATHPLLKRVATGVAIRRADDTIGTFADLPAAAPANEGTMVPISDSATATWGATITGGGSNHVLAYSNGTNWTVMAK